MVSVQFQVLRALILGSQKFHFMGISLTAVPVALGQVFLRKVVGIGIGQQWKEALAMGRIINDQALRLPGGTKLTPAKGIADRNSQGCLRCTGRGQAETLIRPPTNVPSIVKKRREGLTIVLLYSPSAGNIARND